MPAALTLRQRMSLIIGTSLSAEEIVAIPDTDINLAFFQEHGIRAPLLKAARITPVQLKSRGVTTARDFHALEFNTLDLIDGAFCASCVSAFGADDLLHEFLVTPNDAVALAGTPAVQQLGIDIGLLLILCAGAPQMASEVIAQTLPKGECLRGVPPETLLDTGLQAAQLKTLGFCPARLRSQTLCSSEHLVKLGF